MPRPRRRLHLSRAHLHAILRRGLAPTASSTVARKLGSPWAVGHGPWVNQGTWPRPLRWRLSRISQQPSLCPKEADRPSPSPPHLQAWAGLASGTDLVGAPVEGLPCGRNSSSCALNNQSRDASQRSAASISYKVVPCESSYEFWNPCAGINNILKYARLLSVSRRRMSGQRLACALPSSPVSSVLPLASTASSNQRLCAVLGRPGRTCTCRVDDGP